MVRVPQRLSVSKWYVHSKHKGKHSCLTEQRDARPMSSSWQIKQPPVADEGPSAPLSTVSLSAATWRFDCWFALFSLAFIMDSSANNNNKQQQSRSSKPSVIQFFVYWQFTLNFPHIFLLFLISYYCCAYCYCWAILIVVTVLLLQLLQGSHPDGRMTNFFAVISLLLVCQLLVWQKVLDLVVVVLGCQEVALNYEV